MQAAMGKMLAVPGVEAIVSTARRVGLVEFRFVASDMNVPLTQDM
jgi:hypothetical protein